MRTNFETLAPQLNHLIASQVAGLPEVRPDDEKNRVQISPGELGRGDSEIAFVAVVEGDQRRLRYGKRNLQIGKRDCVVSAAHDRVELIAEIASGDRVLETRGLGNRAVRGNRVIHQNRKMVGPVIHVATKSHDDSVK